MDVTTQALPLDELLWLPSEPTWFDTLGRLTFLFANLAFGTGSANSFYMFLVGKNWNFVRYLDHGSTSIPAPVLASMSSTMTTITKHITRI